jgi:DNA-directed RNA polymerase specialized sigma24 family protein
MEKYLFVCQKLAENDFARLRRFRQRDSSKAPKFTTWLAAVTCNLCIDAHRARHGRRQLPRGILGLAEIDQEVFRLFYWRGFSREEIEQQLANTAGHTPNRVVESLERIQNVTSGPPVPGNPGQSFIPFDETDARLLPPDLEDGWSEMLAWLQRWLEELTDQERMIIHLRFWEGMNGAEIATAMRISPEQRVYPLLRKALAHLRTRAMQTYTDQKSPNASV